MTKLEKLLEEFKAFALEGEADHAEAFGDNKLGYMEAAFDVYLEYKHMNDEEE